MTASITQSSPSFQEPSIAVTPPTSAPRPSVIARLRALARAQGLFELERNLAEMGAFVESDLGDLSVELAAVAGGSSLIERGARHLLDLEGKYLRPLCVLLASRAGAPTSSALPLALAVELVHSATLLHDDVVDLGSSRRGVATARAVYGNAASIFAGDFLLVDALRRIRASAWPSLLDSMLEVIDEMIRAESIQLEHRGRLVPDIDTYMAIVTGKTASLFGWAARAGGEAAGLDAKSCEALRAWGIHLGIAFQILDDMLDFTGTASGKDLLADLREGKSTYPLLWAVAAEPELADRIATRLGSERELTAADIAEINAALARTDALAASRRLATTHTGNALAALESADIPDGAAKSALAALATAALHRDL